MRPRVEIEEDSKLWPEDEPKLIDIAVNQRLVLEVLLDLRELLTAKPPQLRHNFSFWGPGA